MFQYCVETLPKSANCYNNVTIIAKVTTFITTSYSGNCSTSLQPRSPATRLFRHRENTSGFTHWRNIRQLPKDTWKVNPIYFRRLIAYKSVQRAVFKGCKPSKNFWQTFTHKKHKTTTGDKNEPREGKNKAVAAPQYLIFCKKRKNSRFRNALEEWNPRQVPILGEC